jgi:hypothetical protein
MSLTSIVRGTNLPNTATKDNVHGLVDNAVATAKDFVNADFKSDAAIADTKLATITTAGKVNSSALTTTSKAAGDFLYNTGTAWARLPVGTAGQRLQAGFDSYTKLLIHADGTDGGVVFTDANATAKTITNTAAYDSNTKLCSHFDGADAATAYTDPVAGAYTFVGTAQLDTAQKKFGSASLLLDGNSDYVHLPTSADWDLGTGDFTFDAWIFRNTGTGGVIIGNQWFTVGVNGNWSWNVNSFGDMEFSPYDGNATTLGSANTGNVVPENQWVHVAVVRSGTTLYQFVNGVRYTGVNSISASLGDTNPVIQIGNTSNGPWFNGYIDEVRISKGIARWTSNFTVPAYPYGQVVTSTTSPKFGTASAYFDGGGSNLSLADSADWDFGTGDFTIDGWINLDTFTAGDGGGLISNLTTASWDVGWRLGVLPTGKIQFRYDGNTAETAASSITSGSWIHYAFVRNGNSGQGYINGTASGTAVNLTGITIDATASGLVFGKSFTDGGANCYNGRFDELRISKGIARWTADFTVPSGAYALLPVWVTP